MSASLLVTGAFVSLAGCLLLNAVAHAFDGFAKARPPRSDSMPTTTTPTPAPAPKSGDDRKDLPMRRGETPGSQGQSGANAGRPGQEPQTKTKPKAP